MHKHACVVPSLHQEDGQVLHPLLEVVPIQCALQGAGVDGLVDLLVCEWVQRCQGHIEEGQGPLEGGLRGEAHVALQQVNLSQADGNHLVAGALEHQVSTFNQVEGQLQVQVGSLAQRLQVGAQLAEAGVVHLAIERDVVLDFGTAVDAVQDVALQVLVNGVILFQSVQRDAVERQWLGDVLPEKLIN